MSDLIERLRGPCPSIPAMRDAADEVGRLRAALAQSIGTVRELMAERDALRARIEGAPYVEAFEAMNGTGLVYATGGLPREWIGKQVRLVMEDGE